MLTASVGCHQQSTGEVSSLQLMLETATVGQGGGILSSALNLALKDGKDVMSVAGVQSCLKEGNRLLLICFHLIPPSR